MFARMSMVPLTVGGVDAPEPQNYSLLAQALKHSLVIGALRGVTPDGNGAVDTAPASSVGCMAHCPGMPRRHAAQTPPSHGTACAFPFRIRVVSVPAGAFYHAQ